MATFKSFFQKSKNVVSPELTKWEYTSSNLMSNQQIDFNLGIMRSFDLSQISVNSPCRVRLYVSLQSRENDRNRNVSTPPSELSGCLIDSIFTNSDFQLVLSPALSFVNSDNPQTSNIYGILENTDASPHTYEINLFVSYPLTEKLDWAIVKTEVGTKQLVAGEKIIAQSGVVFSLPSSGEIYIYADGDGITVGETILRPNTLYLFLYDFSKQEWKIINFSQGGGGGGRGFFIVRDVNYTVKTIKITSNLNGQLLKSYLYSQSLQKSFLSKLPNTALNAKFLNQYQGVNTVV